MRLEVGRQEKKDGSSAIESDKAARDQPIPRSTGKRSEANREKNHPKTSPQRNIGVLQGSLKFVMLNEATFQCEAR